MKAKDFIMALPGASGAYLVADFPYEGSGAGDERHYRLRLLHRYYADTSGKLMPKPKKMPIRLARELLTKVARAWPTAYVRIVIPKSPQDAT